MPARVSRHPVAERVRAPIVTALSVLAAPLLAITAGCSAPPPPPPSFLLFVLDTTRADAVSAMGRVAGTTPTVDALAQAGVRYTRAYAQAPWTLPSHATLFTGLLPSQHGLEWHRTRAPDEWQTLAERLRAAGYETVGVSENGWIGETFNMTQGFDRFTNVLDDKPKPTRNVVADWVATRKPGRPFLLFVNVTDAHAPFPVRDGGAFLPPGVTPAAARGVSQKPADYFCASSPDDPAMAILWGLYLGDVNAADRKLAAIRTVLGDAGLDAGLVTIVTADHGEHFGEHGLVNHLFSVREALLHVPLVVHGLPGVVPAVIDAPVRLADILPSVLDWAGLTVPTGLAGAPLPVRAADVVARPVIAEHHDFGGEPAADDASVTAAVRKATDVMRRGCGPDDRVFGGMRALIRDRYKLIEYDNYPPELYDLAADVGETRNLAAERPALVAELTAQLTAATQVPAPTPAGPGGAGRDAEPAPEVLDMLRALGYVGGGEPEHGPPSPSE